MEEWISNELKSKDFKNYFNKSRKLKHIDYLERRIAELYGKIFHEVILCNNVNKTNTKLFLKYNNRLKKLNGSK